MVRTSAHAPRRQRLGIALVLPIVLLVPYLLLSEAVRVPWVVWSTLGIVLVASSLQLRSLWRGSLPGRGRPPNRSLLLLGTALGVAGLVPLLTVGLDLEDAAVFAVVVALLLVVEVQALTGGQRWSLVGTTAGVWALLLVTRGVTDPAILLLHGAGALVLVVGTSRIADELAQATAAAAGERHRAEQRARVLAEVLRARSSEPGEVHRAVLRGMDAVGFEMMAIRRVDTFAGRAVLVDHRTHLPVEVELDARADLGLLGVAVHERREVVVADVTADPRAIDRGEGFRGGVVVPLLDRGEVFAAIEGAVRSGPLDDFQLAAIRQLAAAAERALVRARSSAGDRRLILELDRVQARTERFVAVSAERCAAPMRALRADVRLLRMHTGERDAEQRAAAVRRIDDAGRRLASLVREMVDDATAAHSNLDLDLQPVGLSSLVATVAERGSDGGIAPAMRVEVARDLCVHVDRTLAQRLIEELVTAVAAHGPSASVRLSARRVGDHVRLTVSGSAVRSSEAAAAPPIARRVVASVTAPRGGESGWGATGGPRSDVGGQDEELSLAIAQQIARAHGSELSIQRPRGRPAVIGCSLPLAK
jgi:signal transduction histidine kinase